MAYPKCATGRSPLTRFFEPTEKNCARGKTVLEENTVYFRMRLRNLQKKTVLKRNPC